LNAAALLSYMIVSVTLRTKNLNILTRISLLTITKILKALKSAISLISLEDIPVKTIALASRVNIHIGATGKSLGIDWIA